MGICVYIYLYMRIVSTSVLDRKCCCHVVMCNDLQQAAEDTGQPQRVGFV